MHNIEPQEEFAPKKTYAEKLGVKLGVKTKKTKEEAKKRDIENFIKTIPYQVGEGTAEMTQHLVEQINKPVEKKMIKTVKGNYKKKK